MSQVERSFPSERALLKSRNKKTFDRVDLTDVVWLRPLFENPWPLFIARSITLAVFAITILAGLIGTPVGNHNFAIIFVWIAWWTALKLLFIPLGGRSWCSLCPIAVPGEWLQHGGLIGKRQSHRIASLRWPKKLRGTWLQTALFVVIGMFSAVTLTDPRVTAWILLGLFSLALVLGLTFEQRAFCKFICPIGGFSALYARTSPLELRVKNIEACLTHREKTCYQECPWGLYPVAFRDASQCGLCLECLRVCPKDNIALSLRSFGQDLRSDHVKWSLDEAFLTLIMLGSALSFAVVFNGPWGSLKNAAYAIGSPQWFVYSAGYLALNLVILPALFVLSIWSESQPSFSYRKEVFYNMLTSRAKILIPLGLFAWIAFTISFALPKFDYVLNVLSDPFGWGWDLFSTASSTFSPNLTAFSPMIQVVLLLIGLIWSLSIHHHQLEAMPARPSAWWRNIPMPLFMVVYTNTILWLLVG